MPSARNVSANETFAPPNEYRLQYAPTQNDSTTGDLRHESLTYKKFEFTMEALGL